ncbi:hypothetical protein, partial [Streptomyces broussonetiae]|uniref:hypothetical protein n=1 Tax=Streptomyces broussonetiae TaxID=2686304 RepID=UPI0035E14C72
MIMQPILAAPTSRPQPQDDQGLQPEQSTNVAAYRRPALFGVNALLRPPGDGRVCASITVMSEAVLLDHGRVGRPGWV